MKVSKRLEQLGRQKAVKLRVRRTGVTAVTDFTMQKEDEVSLWHFGDVLDKMQVDRVDNHLG